MESVFVKKTYLISYDLRKPGRNYSSLYSAIKSYGTYAHVLESVWSISTSRSAVEVRDHLAQHLDQNDDLIVITASAPGAWKGLSQELTDWLKENLH